MLLSRPLPTLLPPAILLISGISLNHTSDPRTLVQKNYPLPLYGKSPCLIGIFTISMAILAILTPPVPATAKPLRPAQRLVGFPAAANQLQCLLPPPGRFQGAGHGPVVVHRRADASAPHGARLQLGHGGSHWATERHPKIRMALTKKHEIPSLVYKYTYVYMYIQNYMILFVTIYNIFLHISLYIYTCVYIYI